MPLERAASWALSARPLVCPVGHEFPKTPVAATTEKFFAGIERRPQAEINALRYRIERSRDNSFARPLQSGHEFAAHSLWFNSRTQFPDDGARVLSRTGPSSPQAGKPRRSGRAAKIPPCDPVGSERRSPRGIGRMLKFGLRRSRGELLARCAVCQAACFLFRSCS